MIRTKKWQYCRNLLRLLSGDRLLHPLAVTCYVTTRCNLNCVYCEDFGARRNSQAEASLSLENACRVLRVIRSGTDSLILTGGEPLLYPEIDALVNHARQGLGFRQITLLTNGYLLPQHEALLPALDRLVVSLDAADPGLWHSLINMPLSYAQAILDNVRAYARRQREFGYQMVVNCVLTPKTLPGVEGLLDFCATHDLLVSFSPQAIGNWPNYDLLVSDKYKAILTRLITRKRQGAPILGSMIYLRTLLDFRPYSCYPLLVPRVMPNGDLVYPCRPIEKENGSHGGRPCNLLAVESWAQALEIAVGEYDPPPRVCTSCFQQCFAEPSLMQAHP
ncbi:MAG: radical SAM protein, partial [Anaerolineales bacterium]